MLVLLSTGTVYVYGCGVEPAASTLTVMSFASGELPPLHAFPERSNVTSYVRPGTVAIVWLTPPGAVPVAQSVPFRSTDRSLSDAFQNGEMTTSTFVPSIVQSLRSV